MPLIIVCGVPCSGKTKRTREIVAILENNLEKQKWTKIDVINDETTAGILINSCKIWFESYNLMVRNHMTK